MIRVEIFPGRTLEQKRTYVKVATEITANVPGCQLTAVSIVFVEVEQEDWANCGVSEADRAG
jgi:4-oxalocrotonate tautomerase